MAVVVWSIVIAIASMQGLEPEQYLRDLMLVVGILERGTRVAALIAVLRALPIHPSKETVDVWTQVEQPQAFDLGRWLILPGFVELEDAPDAPEPLVPAAFAA